MANKQTALEYFYQKLIDSGIYLMSEELEFYEQAKQMEKEQIVHAYNDTILNLRTKDGEQYYNETYKNTDNEKRID